MSTCFALRTFKKIYPESMEQKKRPAEHYAQCSERHGDASARDAVSASAPGPTSFQKSSSSPGLYLNSQEGSEPHRVTSQQV